jgi:hypothetical protein
MREHDYNGTEERRGRGLLPKMGDEIRYAI